MRTPDDLSLSALVVLASWESGVVDCGVIAGILNAYVANNLPNASVEQVQDLADALYEATNPVVRRVVMRGLPDEIRIPLPEGKKVRCGLCGAVLGEIPCLACRLRGLPLPRGSEEGFGDPPLPAQPTDAEPGTMRKIAVMRRRDDRGESVTHPLDAGMPPITDTMSLGKEAPHGRVRRNAA